MSVRLTEEQRRAVEARGRVIVSASAGSGKTFVMITRLVDIILSGADVSEVLAVTFTNKAAAQMRDKLRAELVKRLAVSDGETRARLKAQLNALPLADVSTVHSFCARLLRTHFFLAGVDPAFRILGSDDAEAKSLSLRALDEVFEHAYEEGGEDFRRLLSVYFRKKKDAFLRELVLSSYNGLRDEQDYEGILERAGREDTFEKACARVWADFAFRAKELLCEAEELKGKFPPSSRAAEMAGILAGAAERVALARGLFEAVLLGLPAVPNTPRRTAAEGEERDNLTRLGELSKRVKELYAELKAFEDEKTERARCKTADECAAALCTLIRDYGERYARLKSEAGVLDYGDLEKYALRVLSEPAVREELHAKYKYVFVDEYQDVNPVQESIVSLLAGQDLFLVGDAKQAIYAFRGSDSEFFEQKERELPLSLRLTQNFRSAENILNAVNDVFGRLPDMTYTPMTGGARYGANKGEVLFHRVKKSERRERGELTVYSVLSGSGRTDTSAAAEKIVALVQSEYGREWFDADEQTPHGQGAWKKADWGDIAVLVRKKSGDAERVARMLAARGIPVTSSSAVNVCDYFEARLVLDWLSLLDNPEQDIPLAGAMLSAIGGFSDGELAKIRARYPEVYAFRGACKEFAKREQGDLARKLVAFFERLDGLRAAACVKTAAETVNLLLSLGLEAQIAAKPDGKNRLARVRRLTEEAERAGSVHAFLSGLKAAGYRVDFSESGGENSVKVLTMHASKGLEYPIVILANLDTPFRGSERDEVLWTEEFLAAPKCYDVPSRRMYETLTRRASLLCLDGEDRKGERNLLYVAMTRARYRLHLLFDEKDGAGSPRYAERLSDFFDLSRFQDRFAPEPAAEEFSRREENGAAEETERAERIEAYGMGARYPYLPSTALHVKSSATDLMRRGAEEDAPYALYFSDEPHEKTSVEAGLAYHAFLQFAQFGKDAREELGRMRAQGLLTEEQIKFLKADRLDKIMKIPCIAALAGKRVWRERKFLVGIPANELEPTQAEDNTVYQGAIDLLYEDEEGYGIIDYKYSNLSDSSLREKYAVQIALYKKAVARTMRVDENTVRAAIVNLLNGSEIAM